MATKYVENHARKRIIAEMTPNTTVERDAPPASFACSLRAPHLGRSTLSGTAMRIIFLILTLSVVCSVHAESYKNIGPLDNLGDIKNKFPNAIVEKLNPGWAQATDALYKLSGTGMSGWIVVKFDDLRPTWKEQLEKEPTSDLYRACHYTQLQHPCVTC